MAIVLAVRSSSRRPNALHFVPCVDEVLQGRCPLTVRVSFFFFFISFFFSPTSSATLGVIDLASAVESNVNSKADVPWSLERGAWRDTRPRLEPPLPRQPSYTPTCPSVTLLLSCSLHAMHTTRPSARRRRRPGKVTPAALLLTAAAAAAAAAGDGGGGGCIPGVAGWKLSDAASLGGSPAAAASGGGSGWHIPWPWPWPLRGPAGRSGAAEGGGGAPAGGATTGSLGASGPAAAVAAAAAAVTEAAAAAVEAAARPAKDPSWLVGAAATAATPVLNYSQIMYARGAVGQRGFHGSGAWRRR